MISLKQLHLDQSQLMLSGLKFNLLMWYSVETVNVDSHRISSVPTATEAKLDMGSRKHTAFATASPDVPCESHTRWFPKPGFLQHLQCSLLMEGSS